MRTLLRSALVQTILLQYATLGLGIAWWWADTTDVRLPPWDMPLRAFLPPWILPASIAFVVFIVSACRLSVRVGDEKAFLVTVGLALYVAFVVFREPFLFIGGSPASLFDATALTALPFLCFRILVCQRQWLTVAALVTFLATCVACALCNASYYNYGEGFLRGWVT